MKTSITLLFLFVLGIAQAALAHDVNSRVVVLHSQGPNWPKDRKVAFDDPEILKHADYWGKQPVVEIGGPFQGIFEDIMLLKPGTSLDEAKKFSAADPLVKSGVLKVEVHRWLLFIENAKANSKKK